jgi:hypothetical protein
MSDNEDDERPEQLFADVRPCTAPATRTLTEPSAPAEPAPAAPAEAMAAASLRPSTAAAASTEAAPPPPPPSAAAPTPRAAAASAAVGDTAAPKPSAVTGGDPPVSAGRAAVSGAAVSACASFDALRAALVKTDAWQYLPDHRAGIERAKKYVEGSDKDFLAGFFVMSINEWKVSQPRVVILTRSAYYRVTYNPKNGKIDHYHKTTLDKLRVLEKTVTGLKVYLTEQAALLVP